jgi:ABC-2 type transport system permease protein
MSKIFVFHADIFVQLLRAKLTSIRSVLTEKIINIYIWAGCTIFVMGYLMQSFGLAKNYGPFQLAGILAVVGLFELYSNVVTLVADFEHDRTIVYYLTLPTSFATVLLSYICYYLIISMSMCFALLPLGKLMLWNQLNLASIAWGKLLLFIVVINIVWAILTLVLATYISSMNRLGIVWIRIIFPLWIFGGFQFSWMATNAVLPMLSYVMLLNPVIYATEGIRGALLGQGEYLPFWLCCVVMVLLSIVASWWAWSALKKRLDLV